MMNVIQELNDHSFAAARTSSEPLLLDFYADWCGPCRALAPVVAKFAEENPDIRVAKINVDESPKVASEFGIRGIPTLVLLKGGREVVRTVGGVSHAEIENMVAGA